MKRMTAGMLAGQAVAGLLFASITGAFAQWPRYSPLPAGHGELKLSMAHLTERLVPCVQLSAEELAALPPNMRNPERCERERAPAVIELRANDAVLLDTVVRPVGLARGGRSYLQARWPLAAGNYELEIRLRDTPRAEGFDLVQRLGLTLRPAESALLELGDGEARLIAGRDADAAAMETTP